LARTTTKYITETDQHQGCNIVNKNEKTIKQLLENLRKNLLETYNCETTFVKTCSENNTIKNKLLINS